MRWRVEWLIAVGFGMSLLILLAVGNVSYKTTTDFLDFIATTRRVTRTYELINKLDEVLSLLKDIERGQQGYIITGDEEYLEPYQTAIAPLQQAVKDLRPLTADNQRQRERLSMVEPLILSRLNVAKKAIETRKEQGFTAATRLVMADEGKLVMDKIRQIIGEMSREERTLLEQRDDAAHASAQRTIRTITSGSLLAVILVALASVLIYGRLKERRRAEDALRAAHDQLEVRVGERTQELAKANADLQDQIGRLRESETNLAAAQRIARLGSWELDLDEVHDIKHNPLRLSDEVLRIFGYESADVQLNDRSIFRAIHPDDRALVSAAVAEAIRERTKYSLDHRIVLPDGKERIVHAESDIVCDESGRPMKMVGTFQDITERKQAEQEVRRLNEELEQRVRERTAQLEAAVRELEAFSYSVSHDLRSPLRGIDGFSHVLLEDYGDRLNEEGRSYLSRIRIATRRMGEIIDDLLKLSRVTRTDLNPSRVNLSQMAQAIAADLHNAEPNRAVDFVIASDLEATADPSLIRIALENFLRNAWKFTSKHSEARIEFGVLENKGERVFYVRDDGAGFDMAYADKLFGAFARLHGAEEFDGTGIGLAIVQRIVQRHGGRIWAEAAVEKGATFYFTLAT